MEIVYGLITAATQDATPLGGFTAEYPTQIAQAASSLVSAIWSGSHWLVAAITWFIFNMTRHGKYMYAIGGNPQAAEVAGVPVKADPDPDLHESSSYVWSCRFHAWRKSRWCIR